MVSVTSRVQLGGLRQGTTSRLMVAYIFHIRLASSTKRLHNTSAFPIMATNTRSWGLRPMAAPHFSTPCGKLCAWSPTAGSSSILNSSAIRVLKAHGFDIAAANCRVVGDEAALCRRTAEAIAKGQVVGWFQGRMEWGPRALGNRSILCDPRRPDMKATLNAKIKRRESFRPFAPSVMEE